MHSDNSSPTVNDPIADIRYSADTGYVDVPYVPANLLQGEAKLRVGKALYVYGHNLYGYRH